MPNNTAWKTQIQHVVVLMMENRSFDHLLGDFRRIDPACDGVDPANLAANTVAGYAEPFRQRALRPEEGFALPAGFDPMHEFADVLAQLGGSTAAPRMTGFAQDAFDHYRSDPQLGPQIWSLVQQVMNYVPFGATPDADPLPGIQGLARAFTVCDRWFCSLPGPTWPNRFFAMMGSCHGRVLMPSGWDKNLLHSLGNFTDQLCRDSIFSLLGDAGEEARVYTDGPIPLATACKGWHAPQGLDRFDDDAQGGTLPAFSWIEPDHFVGKDSQHPPQDMRRGDRLIARVYNALRANEATWRKTLLVVVYDEHGGFFDHVVPPATVAPDGLPADVTEGSAPFDFRRLGPRVPALLVSPWLPRAVNHDVFDHTSLLAFVCDRFGLARARLGRRVADTSRPHFGELPIWLDAPRGDAPPHLTPVALPATKDFALPLEDGLAGETRLAIEALHAYLGGGDPLAAWNAEKAAQAAAARPGTRGFGPPRRTTASLSAMADQIGEAVRAGQRQRSNLAPVASATRGAAPEPLRLLCLHGIGHGDASSGWQVEPGWQEKWRESIVSALRERGVPPERIEIRWLRYDDLFGDGPSLLQTARAVPLLLEGLAEEMGRQRAFGLPLPQMLRWTAGMVVQWLEDGALRDRLCARLMQEVAQFRPRAILGHSLGSLIAYDAFRRAVAAPGATAIDGRLFLSFGSQIAHPVVVREVWGGRVEPLHDGAGRGIAAWFHLYNPKDRVFTRPMYTPDERRTDVTTEFDLPFPQDWIDLNHAGSAYLAHPAARAQAWPVVAGGAAARALQAPSVVPRIPRKRRRALLVGINRYPDPSARLEGCVNDVFLVSRVLQESGYEADEVRVLLDERATRAAIVERLQWLAENVQPGDERVLFYSGHGAQIPRYGASDEPDRMDETLVPFDFDWNDEATYLTDKEFHRYYSHLPFDEGGGASANLTVIFDCCHAGGMTRGAARVRGLNPPADIRHRMLEWSEREHDWTGRLWVPPAGPRAYSSLRLDERAPAPGAARAFGARRLQGAAQELRMDGGERSDRQRRLYGHRGPYMPLLLYAAGESELASEYEHGAQSYGAFTYALVEQLRRRDGEALTFRELVEKRVPQALAQRRFAQHPELVGPAAACTREVPWKPAERRAP